MNDTQLETLDQIRQFLEGTEAISFQIESKDARYRWIQHAFFALQSSVFTVLLDQAFYLSQRISRHLPNITGYQSFVCFTERHIAKLH
jgi:hypothetical protein